jgi:orotate phosphoribosyltransferase
MVERIGAGRAGVAGIERAVLEAAAATRGHFRYESGDHGDLWLELDGLLLDARRLRNWAGILADRAAACAPNLVCGPLSGGAFVAQFLAAELGVAFAFAERLVSADGAATYRIPAGLRGAIGGRRVLLADDAVNAGSALLSTLADLRACGAERAGFASLIALGDAASRMSEREGAPFFALVSLEREIWAPDRCSLCRSGMPLVDRVARS